MERKSKENGLGERERKGKENGLGERERKVEEKRRGKVETMEGRGEERESER